MWLKLRFSRCRLPTANTRVGAVGGIASIYSILLFALLAVQRLVLVCLASFFGSTLLEQGKEAFTES
jgi:hypothetical protein